MAEPDFDVVVVGAGVSGLAALSELDRAGCRVLCVEARDRIGGRILTVRDPLAPIPVELGPEFIHGRPPEIWQIVRSVPLTVYDCTGVSVHIKNGIVQDEADVWESVDHLMEELREEVARGREESFSSYLERSQSSPAVKALATSFVEGFNAARKEVIGIASIAADEEAAQKIDGDHAFRLVSGYDSIPLHFLQGVGDNESKIRLNTILTQVKWNNRSVKLTTTSALTGDVGHISTRRLVITVPLGVLQAPAGTAGAICWDPEPKQILTASSKLAFGQVVRIVLRFSHAFWEDIADFAHAGFLFSNESAFPTWWTALAARAPVLTGWSAGPHTDKLLGSSREEVARHAVASLARVLNTTEERIRHSLECIYFHDWHGDPFARGAYSYVPAGALKDREQLATPVAGTLYFAGEATELEGHSATVHGAIASGLRVAKQVLQYAS